ncbi:MAG: MBL fold metallo-hydrolase [Candidatus Latescibacterota bacterium]
MKIKRYEVGPLGTNCYHVICESSNKSVIIDPGGISESLIHDIGENHLTAILLTHGHFDHIGGAAKIAELTGAPIMISDVDAALLSDSYSNGSSLFGTELQQVKPDKLLSSGDIISFGDCSLKVLFTPGHTAGGISFIDGEGSTIFSGDVLFRLTVGRWDLPGGNCRTLMNTLRTVFYPLPDSVVVYPGHGESTTIGFEKRHNQFMTDQ